MKNFTFTLTTILLFATSAVFGLPKLNSHRTAPATIFIDFDGHTTQSAGWNGGAPLYCQAAPLTDEQITEIFNRVAEDYRPFNVNITTDSAVFISAPVTNRIRVIVTPTSYWRTGVGGIAYIGSFTWGDDTPCFVFTDRLGPNNTKYVAECISHESGHTVGLSHQSSYDANCTLTETYNSGAGSGETGWAPIMGNSYYRNMTGWNNGPTPYGCTNTQDNLTIITTQNGFGFRPDDFSDLVNSNAFLLNENNFSIDALISTSSDKDAFRFGMTHVGNLHLEATPFGIDNSNGANLDLKVSLYSSAGTLIRVFDPADKMSVTIDTVIDRGSYYVVIDGTGNTNTDNYGSLGSYRLIGLTSSLAMKNIVLEGSVSKNKHNLSWSVASDDALKTQDIEWSEDGATFKTLSSVGTQIRNYIAAPNTTATLYYRVKLSSVLNQTVYSNIISLKATRSNLSPFMVSNFVHDQISIRSDEDYQFRLFDENGRLIMTGRGTRGYNTINLNNRSAGLYILHLSNQNHKTTERIIKQ